MRNFCLKFEQYMNALRHILNTGEGVILEQSCFSDYVIWEAALKAGWIEKGCKSGAAIYLFQNLNVS